MRTCACVRVRFACTCRAPGEQSWRLIGAFLSVHTVQDLAARDGPRRRSRALRPLQKVPLPLSLTAPHSTALSRYHRCRRIDRLRRGFAHESAAQGVALRFKSPTDLASCGWNVRRAVLGSGRSCDRVTSSGACFAWRISHGWLCRATVQVERQLCALRPFGPLAQVLLAESERG